jgi:hypothetical protein
MIDLKFKVQDMIDSIGDIQYLNFIISLCGLNKSNIKLY